MSTTRPMPAKRRAALEAELKGLRADPHWRAPKLRTRIDKIRGMLAPVKRQRRSRFEIEQQRHLWLPSLSELRSGSARLRV